MVSDQFLYHCLYNETYNPPVAPVAAAALPPEAENAPSRTGKHTGPEGRNSAKIEPKKSLLRHTTLLLLLLLLFLPRLKMHPPGQGNTVALKDGTAPKSSPKSP